MVKSMNDTGSDNRQRSSSSSGVQKRTLSVTPFCWNTYVVTYGCTSTDSWRMAGAAPSPRKRKVSPSICAVPRMGFSMPHQSMVSLSVSKSVRDQMLKYGSHVTSG